MHFDAAVNHRVGAALRMLQEAVGTEIDGEIGPRTRAAVAAKPLDEVIQLYAEIRRARYRALPHFWRFGRGWLNRTVKTEERALALLENASSSSTRKKGRSPMQNGTTTLPGGKWWGQSLTIWGAVITALSTLAPALGPVIGVDVSGDLVRQAGEDVLSVVQVLSTLAGTLMTIVGRARAAQPLERRQVSIRL
jgi:lysozyme family protein